MMDLIQKFLSPHKIDRQKFTDYFFSLPEHYWISQTEGNAKIHFQDLFNVLPASLIKKMTTENPVSFVLSQDLENYSPAQTFKNTVVIFPEFLKLLIGTKKSAVAYLAHELALIFLEIEGREREFLLNEVEADKFVSDLGLIYELEEFLLMLDESVEKRMRLTYLTLNHIEEL